MYLEEINREQLINMELGQIIGHGKIKIMRVYGGWIYNQTFKNTDSTFLITSTFVPDVLCIEAKNI